MVVTSAAGTGKSALVSAFIDAAGPPSVLAGAARVHSPAPYDWLAAVLAGRDGSGLGVPADALAWLAQNPHVPASGTPRRCCCASPSGPYAAWWAPGRPFSSWEDLHALDPASLNLVAELATAGLPALPLIISRSAETVVAPELVARTLARLSGAGAVRRHLAPLDVGHVPELLRRYGAPPRRGWRGRCGSAPAATRTGWRSCSRQPRATPRR